MTGIAFRHGSGSSLATYIDNVLVTVPEPSTSVAIVGVLAFSLIALRRR